VALRALGSRFAGRAPLPGRTSGPAQVALPARIAVLSVHTSPLDQPGTGDAGGMNVYIAETSRLLAAAGIEVEVFTRATRSDLPAIVDVAPGVRVRHITAGPYEGLAKGDLPSQLCAMTAGVMRVEAAHPEGWFDLVHSHYWLSGQVGWLAAERWGVPLVHSMHTMAKVKNAGLAQGDTPEPAIRTIGEEQVVAAATRLVANTVTEAGELIDLYGADPGRVDVVHPGVDLDLFRPGSVPGARSALGIADDSVVLLFVGRIQPLKAPDVLVRAAADLVARHPDLRGRLVVAICGGPSGTGLERPSALEDLARDLGIDDLIRFIPPAGRPTLAQWYQAADLTVVPSHSESFGLVAVESQACGTPVIAAKVGGLRTAVADGLSGVLIPGHDPADYARAISELLGDPARLAGMAIAARAHAEQFGWAGTTAGLMSTYGKALAAFRRGAQGPEGRVLATV
jgi:D-inositol-3-phosphate glycosyltransferase